MLFSQRQSFVVQSEDFPGYDSEGDESAEDAFHLEDVSSDVELNPNDLMDEDDEDEENEPSVLFSAVTFHFIYLF